MKTRKHKSTMPILLFLSALGPMSLNAEERIVASAGALKAITELAQSADNGLEVKKYLFGERENSVSLETHNGNLSNFPADAEIQRVELICGDEVNSLTMGKPWRHVRELSLRGKGITNLDFLQHLPNLTSLSLMSFELTSLDGLAHCVKLKELSLECAKLEELTLADIQLTTLKIARSGLKNLDGLEKTAGLAILQITACLKLENIDAVADAPLSDLSVLLTPVTSIDKLNFSFISVLNLSFNDKLASVQSLKSLPAKIHSINLIRTPLRDFSALEGKNVTILDLPIDGPNAKAIHASIQKMTVKQLGLQLADKQLSSVLDVWRLQTPQNNVPFLVEQTHLFNRAF